MPGARRSKKIPEFGTPFRVPCPTIREIYNGECCRLPGLHELLDVYGQAKLDLPAEAALDREYPAYVAKLEQSSSCDQRLLSRLQKLPNKHPGCAKVEAPHVFRADKVWRD
ncbi:uncharacterized protein LOC112349598 [Selaginella moellendorffii]|uniref:uncharacterized protein LOC112349598 n=1 Tax=Selaginella moellendorffii TaxID=88036 RepID=UPI000D1C507A|nr:uncharacterized protein LOC112349598 [Selaginella moellendorffii]|eukprot:XP_024540046.1 uncharacterized protein LOC112349598 [Selaginella moellendorffii]